MDQGVPRMAAAGVLGASGLTSIFGRVGTGMVADRVGTKRTLPFLTTAMLALIRPSLNSRSMAVCRSRFENSPPSS